MNPQEEIENLKERVAQLEEWKRQRTEQQLTFPLDRLSKDIIAHDFLKLIGEVRYEAGAAGNPFVFWLGEIGGNVVELNSPSMVLFSANPTTDILSTAGWDKFFDGDTVNFLVSTGDSLPAPLTNTGNYTVTASSVKEFKVASGGAVINITDTGGGKYFVFKV